MSGNSTVSGTGVSILLGAGAYLDWQGNPTISLSAMSDGRLAGLVIASDPTGPAQTSKLWGSVSLVLTAGVTGSIYLPNHTLSLGGHTSLTLNGTQDRLAVGALSVAGSSTVTSSATSGTATTIALTQ